MMTRQTSLGLNAAIYGSVVVLVLGHIWFWGVWCRSTHKRTELLDSERVYLEASLADDRRSLAELQSSINRAEAEVQRREKELAALGALFPDVREQQTVMKELLVAIEGMGLKIEASEFPRTGGGAAGGYQAADVALDLMGSYENFKGFLAKVPQLQRLVRILSFQVLDYGDARHDFEWKVHVQLQTYFRQ
jgi:Tfp pilus assembly protein PilO